MDSSGALTKQSSLESEPYSTIYKKFFEAVRSGNNTLVFRLIPFLKFGVDVATKEKKMTPLMIAAAKGYLETVEILLYYGANAELKNAKNQTALDLAELRDREKIVACLENPLMFPQNKCQAVSTLTFNYPEQKKNLSAVQSTNKLAITPPSSSSGIKRKI